MSPLLIAFFFLLAFAVVAAIIYSAMALMQPAEDPLTDRLGEIQSATGGTVRRVSSTRYFGGGFFNSFLYLVSRMGGEDWIRSTERELAQAGIRNRNATAGYLLGNVIFFLLMVAIMLYLQAGKDLGSYFLGLLSAFLLGYIIPPQVLHRLVRRYRAKLQEALPDTVDLLGIVLGTGLALDQAMLRVSEEMDYIYPELASEFATVVMQVKAGQERAKAFEQLTKRTGIEDLKSLAAMIIQSERFGTSLSQSLKVYADSLRNRRRLRAETATAKAGVKMIFPVVLFILPALLVVVFGPVLLSAMQMFRQGFGPR